MEQYISKSTLVAAVKERLKHNGTRAELDRSAFMAGREKEDEDILTLLNTFEVKEVNIADMADDYYDALMEEAAVWMDEGTMCHCRLAYYTGCKDVLNKIQKGE